MTIATMLQAPYRSCHRIEIEAQHLLFEYCRDREPITEPPIPIEEILERHLRLGLSFCDLQSQTGHQDVLGALSVESREVFVDLSLDPEDYPELEGRYRFTLAHEIGHWQLHRRIYKQMCRSEGSPLLSRTSHSDRRLERQADFFAACLLMPRPLVYQQWRHIYGGRIISLPQLESESRSMLGDQIGCRGIIPETTPEVANALLEWAVAPLADEFRVSAMAMRIRLEELRLVVR